MKAIVIENYGSSKELVKKEIKTPKIESGKVLIKVKATSINPIDMKMRSGVVKQKNASFPIVLHNDFAGEVVEVGEGVQQFQIGDKVYGFHANGGALADFILVDASIIAKMPSNLSFAEAAVLPVIALTAWEALVDRGNLQEGQHILIQGGAGGVGHVAIQLAKILGAKVTTTVSSIEKAALVKKLGADDVIFYQEEDVPTYVNRCTDGKGFDIVLDTVGRENLDKSFLGVKERGVVLSIAARSTHDLTVVHNKGLTLHVIFTLLTQKTEEGRHHHGNILKEIAGYVEKGEIKPLLDANVFTYDEIQQAHDYFESGKVAYGKVAVVNQG